MRRALSIAAVILVTACGSGTAVTSETQRPTEPTGSVVTQPPPTPPPAPAKTTPAGAKTFAFNDTATITQGSSDAAKLTVAAPVEFKPLNKYDRAAERGRYVYFVVTFENVGNEEFSYNPLDFAIILPDGQRITDYAFVTLPKGAPKEMHSGDLNPGEKVLG